ncbi:MAG: hypothetical protein AAF821_18250 [Cyanobacteria bacterium P01_D01_bin.156]
MVNKLDIQPASEQLTMLIAKRTLQEGTLLSPNLQSLDPDNLTLLQAHQIVVEKNLEKNSYNEMSEKIRKSIGEKLDLIRDRNDNPNYRKPLTPQGSEQFSIDLPRLKQKIRARIAAAQQEIPAEKPQSPDMQRLKELMGLSDVIVSG